MNKLPPAIRKAMLFAGFLVCLLTLIALTITVRTNSQSPRVLSQNNKDTLLRRVEDSTELPLKVAGNYDCPFRIVQATVKEISGPDFSKLTGRTTDLVTVSSVPEVKLVNTSGETITGFILAVRDPQSRTTRGFDQQKVSISPGETYIVKREHFVSPEMVTTAGENGQIRRTNLQRGMDSEKYWLQFAGRSEVFVTVGKVTFSSGGSWMLREGGEVK